MFSYTVYPELDGFKEPELKRITAKLDKFHKDVKPRLAKIQRKNTQFGVGIRRSPGTGWGLFNGEKGEIPAGVPLAYLPATISTITAWKRKSKDRRYSFHTTFLGRECVYDGKPLLKRYRHSCNISFINHKCKPNCHWIWEEPEGGSGIYLLTLYSKVPIKPNEELCVNYSSNYFVPASRLLAQGLGEAQIQRCKCKAGCTKAFDKGLMERSRVAD